MNFSPRVKWVLNQVQSRYSGKLVLDIGFVGAYEQPFLHSALREQGHTRMMVGLDLDKSGVLKFRTPNSVVGDAKRLPLQSNKFDAVLLLEVLEHLPEPLPILLEIRRVLRSDGELVITTPNSFAWWNVIRHWLLGSLESRIQPEVRKRYLGAPDHIMFYDPFSLLTLLDRCGFQPVSITTKNHPIPLVRRLTQSVGIVDLDFWPANRFGHYLCVVGRKTSSRTSLSGPLSHSAEQDSRLEGNHRNPDPVA